MNAAPQESFKSRLKKHLTLLYGRFLSFDMEGIERYTIDGETWRIYWFKSSRGVGGKATPWSTVMMNTVIKEEYSEGVKEYVLLHEIGHIKQKVIEKLILWPAIVISLLFAAFASAGFLIQTITFVLTESLISLVWIVPALPLLILVSWLPFSVFMWINEGRAEWYAISRIGPEQYRSVYAEIDEKSNRGVLREIFRSMRYPSPELMCRLYDWKRAPTEALS